MQQLFRQKAKAIYIIVGTFLSIGLNMARPYLTGDFFDELWFLYTARVEQGITPNYWIFFSSVPVNMMIFKFAMIILGLGLISFIINISIGVLNENIAQRTERDIRDEFYASVQSKSMAFHDTAKVGELMSQATYDVRIINATISPGLRMITQAIVTASIAFGMIFYLNWRIGLVIIVVLPLYILAVRHYAKKVQPLTEKVQKQFGISNSLLQENISGIRVVRAFTAEKYETKRFQKEVDTLKDDIIARGRQQALYFPPLILSVSLSIALGLSVLFIQLGYMSVGDAITINGVLIQLYDPTYMLSWVMYLTNMGIAGAKRILGTMKEEEIIIEKPNAVELKDVLGRIEYKNVSFSYYKLQEKRKLRNGIDKLEVDKPSKEIRNTLENITLTAEPGDIVAILGPTGCGKSTLTKLLARMYDTDKGKILIDGINIRNVTLESLRRNIGVIEQDIFLFSTTIKENIAYGADHTVTDEEVIEYAKAAQAHEFIMSFKDGYDTLVGERGVTLSGGQKQRIAIARAFLANPRILILDDSASAIDADTEEQIQKAMDNLLQNRTVFIITHRLSTIKRANKIVVMRKGKIVSDGYHEELLKTSEDYRRVFGRHIDLPPIDQMSVSESAGGTK
ncbi:MAG TPA: ABC transporter ATP-binding protein [candidate division Zixibacteria bacterium]|nr:ABC transporter ATP-binding protein [candidate division Zixibacteria bacterium]